MLCQFALCCCYCVESVVVFVVDRQTAMVDDSLHRKSVQRGSVLSREMTFTQTQGDEDTLLNTVASDTKGDLKTNGAFSLCCIYNSDS